MQLLGILFELYLATFAQIAGYHPSQFLSDHTKDYCAPLSSSLELIGNCGELRSNHFHTGWDLSTGGKEGASVFAIEEGYISRIRISTTGYGKAVYITHPNGLTSVYAHLSHFGKTLDSLVLAEMKLHKQNEFDWYWPSSKFKLNKGDCFAYSGNSGASTGPHLHFELRDAFTEIVLNPAMLFEDKIQDDIAPVLSHLALTYQDKNGVRLLEDIYKVRDTQLFVESAQDHLTLSVSGEDRAGKGKYHLGIYSLRMIDEKGEVLYGFTQERLNFANGRFANAVNDYVCSQHASKLNWYSLFQVLNNDWPSTKHFNSEVDLRSGARNLTIQIADEKGLSRSYHINIKKSEAPGNTTTKSKLSKQLICLNAGSAFSFSPAENCWVQVPNKSLYENIYWPVDGLKLPYPPAFHKTASVKMLVKNVSLGRKLGSYVVVKYKGKILEKSKVLWKGDTAVFETKHCGSFEYKYAEKLPMATIKKAFIVLENIEFLSQYQVVDARTNEWLPVSFDSKTKRLLFLEKGKHSKKVKVYCKDVFGRESIQELEISR